MIMWPKLELFCYMLGSGKYLLLVMLYGLLCFIYLT